MKVQHNLTYNHVSEVVSQLLGSDQPSRTKARLRSLQGKGAGAWLETIPSSLEFALKPCNYCVATRLRLGCPMPLSSQTGNPKCDCSKPIDQEGYHLLTCKTGGGPVWTHNTIASVWSECLKHLNKKLIQEPRNRYCNSDDRPDIAVFDISMGSSYELDFAMAHPWCPDVLSRAANEDGAAALQAEKRKHSKYSTEILPGSYISECIPLVFGHFGRWGWEAQKFFVNTSKSSVDKDGKHNSTEFKIF